MKTQLRLQWAAAAAALSLLLAAGSASAETPAELAQAKTFFNAGAQAYETGKYAAAIQAFQEAYKLAPRPAITFSIAQAERKLYFVAKDPEILRSAIAHYRDYLQRVENGGRRADAGDALSELEPIAMRLGPTTAPPKESTPAVVETKTRVMIASQTPNAVVSLDGQASSAAPLIEEVKPGKHKVHLSADGYFDEEREIAVASGAVVALDIALAEKPAQLQVNAAPGTAIAMDGRVIGETPLSQPLSVPAGAHLFVFAKNGHDAASASVTLERGKTTVLAPKLRTTTQRTIAYTVLGVGVLAVAGGAVFTGMSMSKESDAESTLDKRRQQGITPSELSQYETDTSDRDRFRTYAIVGYGAGALLLGTGAVLYFFDHPSIAVPESRQPEKGPTPDKPQTSPVQFSGIPTISPTMVGGSLIGRF